PRKYFETVIFTASKYFRGQLGTPDRERSARHMIERVVKVLRSWGEKNGYFVSAAQAQIFDDELTNLLVYQKGSFNSPVWFNVGSQPEPQCSACFILSAKDDMRDILDWIKTEGMIFKGGSGTGINLSNLRSKREQLSKGGYASGPVSFMRGADSVAGMIKSGGTTRRAAKMVVLDIDHPDMMDFIKVKAEEEKKVRALAAAGYNMADLNNEAWNSIQYQNANNSIRITDDFMEAVERDGDWQTRFRVSGKVADTYKAREVLDSIAQAAWECGDPGVQFDTIINKWHTCPNSGRINASNPCSEYMHLDDSACNLASINLLKFLNEDGTFDVKGFKQAVDVFILAQEIIVSGSYYPTEKITKNAKDFRELGLGFANLGALLMTKGLAYDSDEAQAWSGAIASLMSGEAYKMSAQIAARTGPFAGFAVNREPMLDVIKMHGEEAHKVNSALLGDKKLAAEAVRVWDEAHAEGERNGYRNSQVTVIAPTGTISFMMDCDTTGIEPAFSLVTMKQLVGGGWMKLVNAGIPLVLKRLGYESEEIKTIADHILATGTVEGAPGFKEEHLPIFDCAVRPASGTRSISWRGHVRIVGAVQPFISGAISKTFNMANDVTKEEIEEAYVMAWKLGIKAFAVYRDGSKGTQPLSTSEKKNEKKNEKGGDGATRHRLPVTRSSETHKFSIVGHDGYLTYSMYEDGALAEVFIRMSKQGSTLAGLLDAFAISVSMALQYGVPLKDLAHKFIYTRFEPAGFTENPEIRIATSIIDYIFRYLALRFLGPDELAEFGMNPSLEAHEEHNVKLEAPKTVVVEARPAHIESEANGGGESLYSAKQRTGTVLAETVCKKCGGMMVRTGTCMTCLQCGSSSGGCS
ncbi:vitamin B12-dependent ribonucleotide reductase, partial [Patescibacteria group bacterium]|nr:vitamin B12-dependent ribonucleotide reductase [Patescibacteria group bacterium]